MNECIQQKQIVIWLVSAFLVSFGCCLFHVSNFSCRCSNTSSYMQSYEEILIILIDHSVQIHSRYWALNIMYSIYYYVLLSVSLFCKVREISEKCYLRPLKSKNSIPVASLKFPLTLRYGILTGLAWCIDNAVDEEENSETEKDAADSASLSCSSTAAALNTSVMEGTIASALELLDTMSESG